MYAKNIHVPTRNLRMNVEMPCSNIPSWEYLCRTQIFLLIHNYRIVIRKTSLAGLFAPSAKSQNLDQYITREPQTIVQILIVNTAGNIRLKEISILNSFEQI